MNICCDIFCCNKRHFFCVLQVPRLDSYSGGFIVTSSMAEDKTKRVTLGYIVHSAIDNVTDMLEVVAMAYDT